MKKVVKHLPTPMAGLALGVASLGTCLEHFPIFHHVAQYTAAIIAITILFGLAAKFILHRGSLIEDFNHPVVGSVVPTFAMALMVISTSIDDFSPGSAIVVWSIAVIIHLIFFIMFVIYRHRDFDFNHIVPSWFVPPIGIVVACVTFPQVDALWPVAETLLIFGIISYAIMLPIVLYRLIFSDRVPGTAKPALAILAAPASLCLAGYMTITPNPSIIVVSALGAIALLMTALVYVALADLLRLPFSPGYAAFTFPLVISAIAMFKVSDWLINDYGLVHYGNWINYLGIVEAIVALVIVSYVFIRYMRFLHLNIFYSEEDKS